MRLFLISAVLLSLLAGCAGGKLGPHRIDVQQGNALDQENVARLKPGLNRSQVRFLLGTPLVVDPFRTDRWDYVYVYYKAGQLAEQKRISLFFEGDTLSRIEGDLPMSDPASQAAIAGLPPAAETTPTSAETQPAPASATAADPGTPAELSLQAETDVAKIQPDVIAPVPAADSVAPESDAEVLKFLNEWAEAWARRDYAAYFAAYDPLFVPQGGGSRANWEKRKRQVLGLAKRIEVKIDSPKVERDEEGAVVVTFNQHYRSDRHSDVVVKQLRMAQRDERWLIVEEKVLATPGVGR